MGDKYIRHGAEFDGDGTTSDPATEDGGSGAWNTITYFEGTAPAYGVLAAGDVVYIRSKDAADTDMVFTMSASKTIGSAAGTSANRVTWVIDDGTVWPGVVGTITYSITGNYGFTLNQWNDLVCSDAYNLLFKSVPSTYYATILSANNNKIVNLSLDWSSVTATSGSYGSNVVSRNNTVFENPYVKGSSFATRACFETLWAVEANVTIINPVIEITSTVHTLYKYLFSISIGSANFGDMTVIGGELKGALAFGCILVGTIGYTGVASYIRIIGFKYPTTTPIRSNLPFEVLSMDGIQGSTTLSKYAQFDTRYDGYYPTLYASLPTDPPTPFSVSLYAFNQSDINPALLPITKLYTLASAIKTVTVELLWPSGLPLPLSDTLNMRVLYTDSADTVRSEATFHLLDTPAAITESTAPWYPDPPTYGAVLFTKLKLFLTTAYAIKKNTAVKILLSVGVKSNTVNDIIVIDPDPVIA